MAQKKRKQSQKQLKRQIRKAKERKQRALGSKFRQTSSRRTGDEVVDDMLPLFGAPGSLGDLPGSGLKELLTLLASADMADEPEFEGIIVNPLLCAETFAKVSQEMGMDPETLARISGEEREEAQMQRQEESIRRLLTEELCQDILKGLDALRLRLKREGKRGEAAKAAGLQSFLSQGNRDVWPMIGLVQGIFHRNFTAGFELVEIAMQVTPPEGLQGSAALVERLRQPEVLQKSEELMKKIPGLQGYLAKQVDNIWEEGMEALYSGELNLGLFSPEELKGVTGIFAEFIGYDSATGKVEKPNLLVDSEDARQALVVRLDGYITELLTPERVDQLRGALDSALQEVDRSEKWLSFTMMFMENMEHEDAAESQKGVLLRALLGEVRTAASAAGEKDE